MPAVRTSDITRQGDKELSPRRSHRKPVPRIQFLKEPNAPGQRDESTLLNDPNPFTIRKSKAAQGTIHQISRLPHAKAKAFPEQKTPALQHQIPRKSIVVRDQKLEPTVVFDTFWRLAAERKAIDDKRRSGMAPPWTDDPILRRWRFCNTFRVLDKVSQYIITTVIEKGSQDPTEVVFRVVLFNMFTKIKTYELLQQEVGELTWATYDRQTYKAVLDTAKEDGLTLYTGAFQKPAPNLGHKSAATNHLELLELLMGGLPRQLADAKHMADVFDYLVSFPGMGDFTAYQLLLNLSYSNVLNFSESDFVVAGPGALSGLTKLFGKSMTRALEAVPGVEIDVMRWLQMTQKEQFDRLGLEFSGLGPERLPMQLCDIEHALCEVDKYARAAHPTIRSLYRQMQNRTQIRGHKFEPCRTFDKRVYLPIAWSHPDRSKVRIKPGDRKRVKKRYVINKIVEDRENVHGQTEYRVHWWGYGDDDDTWEPQDQLEQDAPGVIEAYLKNIAKKMLP